MKLLQSSTYLPSIAQPAVARQRACKGAPLLCFFSAVVFTTALCTIASAQAPSAEPGTQAGAEAVQATVLKPPPQRQSYVRVKGLRVISGHTMVPASFLKNEIGAGLTTLVANKQWRFRYFHRTVEVLNSQLGARFDDEQVQLPEAPRIIDGSLYVPWQPISKHFGFKWSVPAAQTASTAGTLLLLQYPGAYIEDIRHSVENGRVRVVLDLSNATRVHGKLSPNGLLLNLAAARRPGVPGTITIGDIAVPSVTTVSGNWKANTRIKLNYAVPATWQTISNPPRVVVDVQKIFEQSTSENLSTGLSFTRISRGTNRGPVRMFAAVVDPRNGWRVRVAPAGYSVLQRQRISRIASRSKAPLAINGGFFAFDGAAVGALKVNNEWIRLPWKGRTAIAFKNNGEARIGNLQVQSVAQFSNGLSLPVRDLNGWPDKNRITALTRRFRTFYQLRAGEMAVVVENGVVTSTPGGGGVNVPANGFVLIGNGGARPQLEKVRKGLRGKLDISAPIWSEYSSALGGGPRLVTGGKIDVRQEGFRSDVTNGLGPRTAIGVDKYGRYIILVVDGRRANYSTGLTLTELAYTMQKLGAVDAMNLDGGGSTAMAMRGRVVNRPSDGSERSVSNALLITR